ncbi:hypothetical protein PR202_ga06954 [Eleusine coracana subsp. coracana]|uniref:Uncharacterized protein n=1 Tax=Eleusine coracana subsp. coracana TaxID=191504 RepID=A0AAV5BYN9_ELECO|nr:hypothetical protein PR202_ga06954 [Eleusine coracana subsp. coracana]
MYSLILMLLETISDGYISDSTDIVTGPFLRKSIVIDIFIVRHCCMRADEVFDDLFAIILQGLGQTSAAFKKWERSDRMAIMVMTQTISPSIKGFIPTKTVEGVDPNAKEFLAKIEENFKLL